MNALELLTLTEKEKCNGVWLEGFEWDGEWKDWWSNNILHIHDKWKNGKLEGDYKVWDVHGYLYLHRLYNHGNLIKDYLKESREQEK